MDWDDATRVMTLGAYLLVAAWSLRLWHRTRFSLRRRAVAMVSVVGVTWALFYAYITPLYWGGVSPSDSVRDVAMSLSRVAHLVTIVAFVGMLHQVILAERKQREDIEHAVSRLQKTIGGD